MRTTQTGRKANRLSVLTADDATPYNSFTRIKFCRHCNRYHPVTEFPRRPGNLDGLANHCRAYFQAASRRHYAKHHSTILTNRHRARSHPAEVLRLQLLRQAAYLSKNWAPILKAEQRKLRAHRETHPLVPYWSSELHRATAAMKHAAKLKRKADRIKHRRPGRPRTKQTKA